MSIAQIEQLFEELEHRVKLSENLKERLASIEAMRELLKAGNLTGLYSKLRSDEILFFDDMRPDFAVEGERRPETRFVWEHILALLCDSYSEVE